MPLLPLVAVVIAALAGDSLIKPGARIGSARLGQAVPASFGQPDHSDGAAGHLWSTWKGSTGNTLDIFSAIGTSGSHEIKLVRVTSNWFHTASGVQTGQTW